MLLMSSNKLSSSIFGGGCDVTHALHGSTNGRAANGLSRIDDVSLRLLLLLLLLRLRLLLLGLDGHFLLLRLNLLGVIDRCRRRAPISASIDINRVKPVNVSLIQVAPLVFNTDNCRGQVTAAAMQISYFPAPTPYTHKHDNNNIIIITT